MTRNGIINMLAIPPLDPAPFTLSFPSSAQYSRYQPPSIMISSGQPAQPVIEWNPLASDHVLLFREQLESRGAQGQLFTCPTTGTEVLMLIPSLALKRQLDLAPARRERSPSPAAQSPPGQEQPGVAGPAGHPPPGREEEPPPRLQPLPAPPPERVPGKNAFRS